MVFALRPTHPAEPREWLFALIGPIALATGSIGLVYMTRLRAWERVASAIGTGLGSIGTVALVASLAGVWEGLPQQPPVTTADMPAASQPTLSEPTLTSPEEESLKMAQIAGTLNFLLTQGTTTFPASLATSAGGLIVLPAGTLQLPVDSRSSYEQTEGGSGYRFTISGANGGTASYDSAVGAIETYILS